MTVIIVATVTGSPGATRLALGLAAAWPVGAQRRVLVEADPDGGRLGAELGIGVEPGLMALALAARTSMMTPDELVRIGAAPVADWFVVPAPPSAEQAHSALMHAASSLATVLADAPPGTPNATMWIVDAGRLSGRSPALPLGTVATHLLVVAHGSFPSLQLVPHRVETLRAAGCHPEVVIVEPTSWTSGEIAEFVGADVVGVLPRVRGRADAVGAMRANAWRPWWNAVDALAGYLAGGELDLSLEPDPARIPRHLTEEVQA